MLRRGAAARDIVELPLGQVALDPIDQECRIADHRVERRPQLVRHAGEEIRLELVDLHQLFRLPEESLVLLRQIRRRLGDASFELAVELFQCLV